MACPDDFRREFNLGQWLEGLAGRIEALADFKERSIPRLSGGQYSICVLLNIRATVGSIPGTASVPSPESALRFAHCAARSSRRAFHIAARRDADMHVGALGVQPGSMDDQPA
jgi:hypothetical protein